MPEPSCTIRSVSWRDRVSDPQFLRFCVGDQRPSAEKDAIPQSATLLDVTFLVDGPMPSVLVKEAQQGILARLQAVREKVQAEDNTEAKIAELLDRRRTLSDQLDQAESSAALARQKAAQLVKSGQDPAKEEQSALKADEHARTLTAALSEVRTPEGIRGQAYSLLQGRLRSEAERIRAEVLQRQREARTRPPDAAGAWLIEIAVADRLAQLVEEPTAAQRSVFGSAVGWLDNLLPGLSQVNGYQPGRGVHENYAAPVTRGF